MIEIQTCASNSLRRERQQACSNSLRRERPLLSQLNDGGPCNTKQVSVENNNS
jgi:hypothetical protein